MKSFAWSIFPGVFVGAVALGLSAITPIHYENPRHTLDYCELYASVREQLGYDLRRAEQLRRQGMHAGPTIEGADLRDEARTFAHRATTLYSWLYAHAPKTLRYDYFILGRYVSAEPEVRSDPSERNDYEHSFKRVLGVTHRTCGRAI